MQFAADCQNKGGVQQRYLYTSMARDIGQELGSGAILYSWNVPV